jgi:hypothetical protein
LRKNATALCRKKRRMKRGTQDFYLCYPRPSLHRDRLSVFSRRYDEAIHSALRNFSAEGVITTHTQHFCIFHLFLTGRDTSRPYILSPRSSHPDFIKSGFAKTKTLFLFFSPPTNSRNIGNDKTSYRSFFLVIKK